MRNILNRVLALIMLLALVPANGCSAPEDPAEDLGNEEISGIFEAGLDLDRDGNDELFKLDIKSLVEEGSTVPYIETSRGVIPFPGEISTFHASYKTYAFTEMDGSRFILEYSPYVGGGSFSAAYRLYTFRDDVLTVEEEGGFSLLVNDGSSFDVDKAVKEVERINEIWEASVLLVSTDRDFVMRSGLCFENDGQSIKVAEPVLIYSGYTPSKAKYDPQIVYAAEQRLSYKETCSALSLMFGDLEGFDTASDVYELLTFVKTVVSADAPSA